MTEPLVVISVEKVVSDVPATTTFELPILSIILPVLFFTYVAPFSLYKEAPLEVVPNTRALPIPSPFMIIAPTELSDFWITNWPV